jgi:hypothetical protein
MPFLEDIGPREDPTRGPVMRAFAAFTGQLERLIAVNLLWAVQLVPGFAAVAFGDVLPGVVRLLLLAWTALALAAGTTVLYAVARIAADGGHIGIADLTDAFRELALPGLRSLGPLYALFGVLLWVLALPAPAGITILAGWLALVALVASGHWAPAVVAHPAYSMSEVLRDSVRRVVRHPGRSLGSTLVWVVLAALGVLSVGGLFLVVPILVALVQTETWRATAVPAPARARA